MKKGGLGFGRKTSKKKTQNKKLRNNLSEISHAFLATISTSKTRRFIIEKKSFWKKILGKKNLRKKLAEIAQSLLVTISTD